MARKYSLAKFSTQGQDHFFRHCQQKHHWRVVIKFKKRMDKINCCFKVYKVFDQAVSCTGFNLVEKN